MPAVELRPIVAKNVRACLGHKYPGMKPHETGVSKLVSLGLSQGTAARLLRGETDVGLGLLADLAHALDLQPWHLLVPDLDPAALPGVTADMGWPFEMVSPDTYWSLPPADRLFLQGRMQQWLEQAAAARAPGLGKRAGNGH